MPDCMVGSSRYQEHEEVTALADVGAQGFCFV
jgi:hypothetical protein